MKRFPAAVREVIAFALVRAQQGGKHVHAKVLHGFGGAGVLEIVESAMGSAYRSVYTVRFREAVYVLHAFQKKSKKGKKTDKQDIDLVKDRLREAEKHYNSWHKG